MRISINVKALGAFKKLGAVALITATIFFVACNQTGGGGGGKPKHAITFSVDGANGKLTAKVDGGDIASGKEVEEGKTVTFTAKANTGYRVKGWTLDGSPITEAGTNTEYKLKVSKSATVKVSFEAIPPTKYTVTLNQTEGGTVTASPVIPTDKQVAKDTEITFTATANEGYKIGKWTVTPAEALQAGTGADGSETAKVKITADTTVSVSFELNPVEGGAVLILSPDKLTIEVRAVTADNSAITVEGCNVTTFASGVSRILRANGTTVILKGKIITLFCSDNKLTSLNVQGLTALQELSCKNNKLTELNVQGCTSLQKLHCSRNQLTALNVQGLTALKVLECQDNKLTALNVQGLTSLQELICSRNQLTALNVQGLTSLQELICSRNQLTALNVQGLTALKVLECQDNKLTALNVQGCTALQKLWCYNNKLTELNVQGLTALQKLWCYNNKLTELNVQGCTALKDLSCESNQLNAQAMTEILNALPAREAGDNAKAFLYSEKTGESEDNCKDFTQSAELKDAFDGAKNRKWGLKKINASGYTEDI